MVECTRFEEGNVETGSKAPVHIFVYYVVRFAANETGFEEVVAELGDARIRSSMVGTCDSSVGGTEEQCRATIY
jgi:hypothetical protein